MKSILTSLRTTWKLSRFKFKTCSRNLRSLPYYRSTWRELRRQAEQSLVPFHFGPIRPILEDRFAQAGVAGGHYFHQDLHVARRVYEDSPEKHIDVGSRVDGFAAHVASFRPIEAIDVRPLSCDIPNRKFLCADVMDDLPSELVESTDSPSSLHAIEHFGLGRYGDPVNFDGHHIGLRNMTRMLTPGGKFYLSTPIGREQRIEFNAHRVFSLPCLREHLEQDFEIRSRAYVDDAGQLHTDVALDAPQVDDTFNIRYGCGILEMMRKAA